MRFVSLLVFLFVQSSFRILLAESFHGVLTLPLSLKTTEGNELPPGRYDVEIRSESNQHILVFIKDGHKVSVKGNLINLNSADLPATIPIIGTHFLRSSEVPLRTAQERQFSQTGLPQYAEESRNWKATLRGYRNNTSAIFFVFQVRDKQGNWRRMDFELREHPAGSPLR